MAYNDDVIQALEFLRNGWDGENSVEAIEAFNTLDNAGVFQEIDEQTAYGESVSGSQGVVASASSTAARVPNGLDPAEWGDLAFRD